MSKTAVMGQATFDLRNAKKQEEIVEKELQQADFHDKLSTLKFSVKPAPDATVPDNIVPPVTIEFRHVDVDNVEPVFTPIQPDTLIDEMSLIKPNEELEKSKNLLMTLKSQNEELLKGSKVLSSIERVLEKNTQEDLSARYNTIKESIKGPVVRLNDQLVSELTAITRTHNKVIGDQIKKTSMSANQTVKKYRGNVKKQLDRVNSSLSGKSNSALASFGKTSKLQKLQKSASQDKSEIDNEVDIVKRFVFVKDSLLNSRLSTDAYEISEAQIEVIAEALPMDGYQNGCDGFINNVNGNTAQIVVVILEELKEQLSLFDPNTTQYTTFKGIVTEIINSLFEQRRDYNDAELLTLIKTMEADNNDSRPNPLRFADIKISLMEILDKALEGMTQNIYTDTLSVGSDNTSSTTSFIKKKAQEDRQKRIASKRQQYDLLTPAIMEVKKTVDDFIPNIGKGDLLLTTLKTTRGAFSGPDTKAKHYYLTQNGTVKQINSDKTYKLSITKEGQIPANLTPLTGTVSQKLTDKLSKVPGSISESYSKAKKSIFSPSPLSTSAKSVDEDFDYNKNPMYARSPSISSDSTSSISSTSSFNRPFIPPPMNVKSNDSVYGPEPPPRKTLYGNITSLGKGIGNIFGRKTSKNIPAGVKGGRRRTRKFRKSKTHKRHSRR